MTYKELQSQLKTFKSQGLTTIALNAKKDILEVEYNRIMNAMVKDAIATEYEEVTEIAVVEIDEAVTTIEEIAVTEIEQDYKDLCDRIAQEISEIEEVVTLATVATLDEVIINDVTKTELSEALVNTKTPDNEKLLTILTQLIIIFVSSIVKVYCQVRVVEKVTLLFNTLTSKADNFYHWYLSGFNTPRFA